MHLEGNHIRSFLHARGRVGRLRTVRGGGSANVACGRFQYQSVRKSGGRRAQVQIRGVRKNIQIIKTTVEHIARLRVRDRRRLHSVANKELNLKDLGVVVGCRQSRQLDCRVLLAVAELEQLPLLILVGDTLKLRHRTVRTARELSLKTQLRGIG